MIILCGEDGTGKAILHNGEKSVEFVDLEDPFTRELARELAREHLGLTAVVKAADNPTKVAHSASSVRRKHKGRQLDLTQQVPVTSSTGESTARKDAPGKYDLYRDKETGKLTGILTTPMQTIMINLGSIDEPDSKISLIKKAVMAMPYYDVFSRHQLSQALPAGMTKRGEIMKFALDYLEEIGLIVKQKERDRSTHGILYKRINEKRDAPAAQSGEDGAKAIPR